MVEGFAYEIISVEVNGDRAIAHVKLTCKQLYPACILADSIVSNSPVLKNIENQIYPEITDEELNRLRQKYEEEHWNLWVPETIVQLEAATPVTTDIVINLEKSGSRWIEAAAGDEYDKTLAEYKKAFLGSGLEKPTHG